MAEVTRQASTSQSPVATTLPQPTVPQGTGESASLTVDIAPIGYGNPAGAASTEPSETLNPLPVANPDMNPVSSAAAVPTVPVDAMPWATFSTLPWLTAPNAETPASMPGSQGTLGNPEAQSIHQPTFPVAATGTIPTDISAYEHLLLPEHAQHPYNTVSNSVDGPLGGPAAETRGSPGIVASNAPSGLAGGIPADQLYRDNALGPLTSAVPANFCQGKFGWYADPYDRRCWVVCLFSQTPGCCPNGACYTPVPLTSGFCNVGQVRSTARRSVVKVHVPEPKR